MDRNLPRIGRILIRREYAISIHIKKDDIAKERLQGIEWRPDEGRRLDHLLSLLIQSSLDAEAEQAFPAEAWRRG